jgi:putative photosynthetic complex assembly protein
MSIVRHRHEPIPRAAVVGACTFVLMTLAGVTAARLAGMPPEASPAAIRTQERVAAVKMRDLQFADLPDGSLRVIDAANGQTAQMILAGSESGFVRGVMRGMARERKKAGATAVTPFRLTLWANGQLTLVDPATGRDVELSGFGDTNRAAFLGLLKGAR